MPIWSNISRNYSIFSLAPEPYSRINLEKEQNIHTYKVVEQPPPGGENIIYLPKVDKQRGEKEGPEEGYQLQRPGYFSTPTTR